MAKRGATAKAKSVSVRLARDRDQHERFVHALKSWATSLPLGQKPTAFYLNDLLARLEPAGPMEREPVDWGTYP